MPASRLFDAPIPLLCPDPESQASQTLHEQLERAAHTAHAVACQLRLLISPCLIAARTSLHLSTEAFAGGMQQVSEGVEDLVNQLDRMPLLGDHRARSRVVECSLAAERVRGLLRLMSDATGAVDAREFEVDVEDFAASLQHLADRMREIEEALEGIASPTVPHCLSGGEPAESEAGLAEADRGDTISGDELFDQLHRQGKSRDI